MSASPIIHWKARSVLFSRPWTTESSGNAMGTVAIKILFEAVYSPFFAEIDIPFHRLRFVNIEQIHGSLGKANQVRFRFTFFHDEKFLVDCLTGERAIMQKGDSQSDEEPKTPILEVFFDLVRVGIFFGSCH